MCKKPQINADERRLNVTAQSPQRTQRAQSDAAISSDQYEKVQLLRTRMTRIGRIFTDEFNPCASVSSVQSVFYHNYSGIQIKAIGGI
ncbi:MAG: hypothetical protein O8C63_07010 [Candidatus Methanoperedens sp.]|nr:hypothetical protein [Candidatus Methanoperedens sp.]